MWFLLKEANPARLDQNGSLGRCRKRAPTMSGFPAVFEADWCGDHKLDEGKLGAMVAPERNALNIPTN